MTLHHAKKGGLCENVLLDKPREKSNHGDVFVLAARVVELDVQARSKLPRAVPRHRHQGVHEHREHNIWARAQRSADDVNRHAQSSDHAACDFGLPATRAVQGLDDVSADAAVPREVELMLGRSVDVHGGTIGRMMQALPPPEVKVLALALLLRIMNSLSVVLAAMQTYIQCKR
eukprot:6214813-Pleurochrysis_carterae.AAC.4